MSKSPINRGFLSAVTKALSLKRKGARGTAKSLGEIENQLTSIEEKMDLATNDAQGAVPPEEGLDNTVLDSASEDQGIETPGMTNEASAETPSAVEGLEEEAYATAGASSGLNMMKRIARR